MINENRLIELLEEEILRIDTESTPGCGNLYGRDASVMKNTLNFVIDLINEQPKFGEWIPCNERLPEEKKFYEEIMRSPLCLVTVLSDDELMIGIDRTVNGVWTLEENFDKPKIIAWQPLPERYECHSKKLKKNSKGNRMTNLDEIKKYLDSCIVYWRKKRDEESCEFAKYYIDAFQSIRNSIFDELLE